MANKDFQRLQCFVTMLSECYFINAPIPSSLDESASSMVSECSLEAATLEGSRHQAGSMLRQNMPPEDLMGRNGSLTAI